MLKRIIPILLALILLGACNTVQIEPTSAPTIEVPTALPTELPTATTSPTEVPPPTDIPAATETSAPIVFGPDNFPANVNPLTGLSVADPSILERRPVSVKVQIFPRGQRPPWGVSLADIVYDYYQNNGMTRFHAIFYSNNAEQVGPIRSGRLFDGNIVSMYNSILAFGGADSRILNRFFNSDYSDRLVFEGSGNCPPMCRIDPNGSNFLVANTQELTTFMTDKGLENGRQNLNGMTFNSEIPAGGQPVEQVLVRFSISAYNRWDLDAATGRYLRFQDAQEAGDFASEVYTPLTDQLTGQQIAADNIVILALPHRYMFKSGNSEIVEIELGTDGSGYAIRDGMIYQIQWNRPAKDSVLYLTFPDGTPYPYKPGNTWYQIIGESSTAEAVENNTWRFTFSIP
ncbi:MAG TPA: DUF3048 domain-containing protein [Anaerolineales bacterium]|nr:DUF3048 domain-containing protein [Anaerolineales bacterium]